LRNKQVLKDIVDLPLAVALKITHGEFDSLSINKPVTYVCSDGIKEQERIDDENIIIVTENIQTAEREKV